MAEMKNNILFILFCFASTGYAYADELSLARQSELQHLLLHDCGSCHGMTLKGGLGPALTPQALVNKPEEYLLQVISNGLPNTPMPPWKGMLTEKDMQWLVSTIKKGVGP